VRVRGKKCVGDLFKWERGRERKSERVDIERGGEMI